MKSIIIKPLLNQHTRPSSSGLALIPFDPFQLIRTLPILRAYSCRIHHLSVFNLTQAFSWTRSNHPLQFILRTYVNNKGSNNNSEQALMNELHRLSHRQENSQPTLGPFLMPRGKIDENPLRLEESHHWSQVNWSERIRRSFRMTRNLVIVSFGGCLGLLVIYSITSELFAPSSTTNLINTTIKTLEESERLKQKLKSPFKFHTSNSPSQSKHNQTGTIELRFWVESYKPNHAIKGNWKTLEWWKSWIAPLITSQVVYPSDSNFSNHQSLDSNSTILKNGQDSNRAQTNWWPGLLRSVMPNTFGSSSPTDQRPWSDRFFSKHGSFDHGEVVAELIKEPDGQWKYKTLVVDFPDSHNLKYRLDIIEELRRKQKQGEQNEGNRSEGNQTRYRFWNRRINL